MCDIYLSLELVIFYDLALCMWLGISKSAIIGSRKEVAHALRTLGLILSHPIAFSMSNRVRASNMSPVSMEI